MGLTLFFVFAFVAKTIAGPIQEVVISEQCARQCTVSNKFNYEIGKTYEFTYSTELRTLIQGASEDQAGIDLTANVYLDFISKCDMVLRLSDVKLMEQIPGTSTMKPVNSDLISGLERNPLTVSFQDGNIEELCLSQLENDKILNIKRGILSVIQNNMDDISKDQTVTESDVTGECETEYTSSDIGWSNKLIKKSKNLLGCKGRQGGNTAIQGIPYTSNSGVQSLPVLKSTHECEQEIIKSTGRLQSAKCLEQHRFAPFSRQDSGATTHNTQTLTFVKEYKSHSTPVQIYQRAPIQFQHSSGNNADTTRKNIEQKLMEICSTTKDGVTPETPKHFSSLVYIMKAMTSDDLTKVYQRIKSKEICPTNNARVSKFFLDAIPMAGTTDSLRVMIQLLTTGKVTGLEADMWMTSLAFIQNPSIEMLAEVKSLLSMKTNQEKAMLSVSSMVNTVCRNNPSCDNLLEVKKIISMLENNIASSCKISDDTFQTSLLSLRAIGNAGFGTGAIPTLMKCIRRTENPIEIRLSAIEAFRRIPCTTDKLVVLSTFTDIEEDSEIRIAAYKVLMECPSDYIISKVKAMLGKEEVNQVGSYVWSHLTNLMETSDPHKQSIRSILEDEQLQKEFDLDNRKFSRNYEKSLFIEKLNTGATAESDLIWSSKSFIPRSAMVNLTVDLFGNAVNLFEMGGRVEGLEYFLESYFGPNGYFSEKDANEATEETAIDVIKSEKVNRIDKRNKQVMDELRGSMYLRVFGNELKYMNFQGLDSIFSKNSLNFLDILMTLSNENDYQYTHSAVLMDTSIIVPTSSGFPLNLTVNGTATIDMKASGKMDVMKLTSSPPTLDVHGIIRPSGAVVVSSIMGIDALDTQIGIKMVSTLHSSTSVQGKVLLTEGKILDVDFDLPEEKQEIISISSSFYTVHSHSEREQKMITENRQTLNACSGNKLAKITGLEICGELAFPNASIVENAPYFPLTGPIKAAVILFKRDKTMSGYKLQARSTHTADENIVRFAFSTPNSKIDRSFGVDLSLNKPGGALDVSFNSPWKKADFKGTLQNEKFSKGISGRLNWDGLLRFDIKANLQSEKSGPGMVYTPTMKISVPGIKTIDFDGIVKYAPWKSFESDFSLSGLRATPISIKASFLNKPKIMSAGVSLQLSPKEIYSAESSMQKTEFKKKIVYQPKISIRTPTKELFAFGGSYTNVYGKNILVDMVLDKIVETPIKINANIKTNENRRKRITKIVSVKIDSKLLYIKLRNKFEDRNSKTLTLDTDLTYVIRRIARDNLKLVSKLQNFSTKSLTKGKGSLTFSSKRYPTRNININGNIDHSRRLSEIEAQIAYGPDFKDTNKQINCTMSLNKKIISLAEASVVLGGKLAVGDDFTVVTKLDHSHEPKSMDSSLTIRVNKEAISSNLILKDTSKDLKNLYGKLELVGPGRTIEVSQLIEETEANSFTSTMNARYGKSKNNIVTSWKKISPSALTISSNVNLNSFDPLKIDAEYILGPDVYKIGGSVQKASSKYSAIATSQIDLGNSIQISTDIEYPTRHIIGNLEGIKSDIKYSTRADVRWNADKDDTQRITINGNGQMTDLSNVDGSLTVQYPSRTIVVNLRNSKGSKYSTHVDFQWEPSKVVSFDSTFADYKKLESREIINTVKFSSPFSFLKSLEIDLNHQINSDTYQTTFDVEWNPDNAVSGRMTVKKPFTLKSINMDLIAKAPSLGYRSIESSVKHTINDGVSTTGKLTLNKQSVQVDLHLSNKGNGVTSDLKGQIDVKTTYRQLRTATITLSHQNNGSLIASTALLNYNKKLIGFQGTTRTKLTGLELNSNGEITFYLSSEAIKATWGHKNTLSEMTSKSEITWDNKRIFVSFNGLQDLSLPVGTLSAALEIQTPFNSIKNAVFQINHLHKRGQIDSTLTVANDGNILVSIEGKYLRENEKVTSRFSASNPFYDGVVAAELTANYQSFPNTGHLELSLTPLQIFTFDGSYDKKSNGDIDTALTISIPNKQPIELTATRQTTGDSIKSAVSCKYEQSKVIRLESMHSTGVIKHLKLKFDSPFTTTYTAEGLLQTSRNRLRIEGNVEAQPFLSRWSVATNVDTSNGLSGNLKVTTPYQDIPYSKVSVQSQIIGSSRQSSVTVEYVPGSIVKLSNMFRLNSLKDIQVTLELSTPFAELQYTSAAFRYQGDYSAFSSYGEIEYRREKISAETKFSSTNGIQTSFLITSPFTDDISGNIRHNGNISNFSSHGEIKWGKTVVADLKHEGSLQKFSSSAKLSCDTSSYSGNINFNQGPKMTTDISITTPIPNFESIYFSHSFEGRASNFLNHGEFSTSYIGTVSLDVKADLETTIAVSANAKTPVKGFNDINVVFTHEGDLPRFLTHVELKNGNDRYSGDIKLNTDTNFNFETTITTPFKSYRSTRLSLTNEGSLDNFRLHGEAQLNKDLSEIDLICNVEKKYDIDLSIKSPYINTIKASLDHWGSWKKFQSRIDLRSGTNRIISSAKFAIRPSFSAQISFKSPFAFMRNQQLSLKHAGNFNSFKCNMNYRCNGKTYTGEAAFQNLNNLNAELKLKGPTFRPINVAVSHTGKLSNFKSSASVSMGKRTLQVDTNFNAVNGVKGNIGIVTPFDGYESFNAAVSHNGELNNFKSYAKLTYNRKSGQVDITFDATRDISATVAVATPFEGYSNIASSVKYQGTINNFNTLVSFSVGDKSVEGQALFQTTPSISGSTSVKSNFGSIKSYDASFNHNGNWTKFNSNGELKIGSEKSTATVIFDCTNAYDGRLSINSPFMKKTDIQFRHSSNEDSLDTVLSLDQDDLKQYGLQLDLTRKPLSGILTITTPHPGYESTELSLHHNGTTENFRSSALFNIFGNQYEGEIVFESAPDMVASLKLRSPISEEIEGRLSFQGTPSNFNLRFNYLYGRESQMLIDSSLNIDGPYSGNIKLLSPLMKNIIASFNHNGGFKTFSSEAHVIYAEQKTDVVLSLKNTPEIEATFRFASPFTKDLEVKFSHDGPLTNCQSSGAVTYGGETHLNVEGKFRYDTDFDGGLKIRTSIPGFSQLTGDISYRPSEGKMELSSPFTGEISGSYKYTPAEGNIYLLTPFLKDIRGSYNINGELSKSASEAELIYGEEKLIQIQGKVNFPRSVEISIQTPIEDLKNLRLSLTRSGDIGGNVIVELNGVQHQGVLSINTIGQFSASSSLNTPLLPHMSSSVSFTGKLSNFRSHADFALQSNKHTVDAQFSILDKIEGGVTVTSPLISDIAVTFSTTLALKNLDSSVVIFYGSEKIVSIQSTFENDDRKNGMINFTLLDNSFNAAFTFTGQVTDFRAHAEAAFNDIKTEGDATFSNNPISASISLKSPYTDPIKAEFNIDGDFENFKGHFELSVENAKSEVDFSFGMTPLKVTIALKSPMKNIDLTFTHDGSLKNFRTQTDVTVDNIKMDSAILFNIETTVEGSATVNIPEWMPMKISLQHETKTGNLKNLVSIEYGTETLASSEISFSNNPFKVDVSMKTPFEGYRTMSALISHSGEMLNFNNHVEITIEEQKSQGDMSFNFGSKLQGRVSASSPLFQPIETGFEFSGTIAKFSSNADFSFAGDKYALDASVNSESGIDASIILNTPIQGYRTITSKLTHSGQYPKIDSFAQVKSGRRNLFTGSATIDNVDSVNGKLSVQSVITPTVQISIKHSGTVSDFYTNTEVRVNGNPAIVNLSFKTSPSVSGTLVVQSPIHSPFSGTFDLKSVNDEIALHMEGTLGKQSIVGDASVEYGDTIGIRAAVKTPFQNFEDMKGSFKAAKTYKGLTSNADFEIFGKKVEADVKSSWVRDISGTITIKTPFEAFRRSSADFSLSGEFPNIQTEINVAYSGQKYSLNGAVGKTNARMSIATPYKGYEDLSATVNFEGNYQNMKSEARVNYMTGKEIFASFQNTMTENRLQTKARLETPYTEEVVIDLAFNGNFADFSNTLVFSVGDANSATSTTTFKLGDTSFDFDTNLKTILAGYADEQLLRFSYEGSLPNIRASANAKFLGSYFSYDSSLQVDDSITGMMNLKSPYAYLKDFSINFEHTGSSRRFSTKADVQYDTNKKIEGSVQYVKYGWRRLQTSINVKTPFAGFETSKVSYRHTASVDSFECDCDLSFMESEFNGNVRASMTPLSVSVSVSTPFSGFEQIGADSKLTYRTGSFNAEGNIQYMQGKTVSLSSSADFTTSPQTVNIKLITPFKGYEDSEIRFSNNGNLRNFQSEVTMSLPIVSSVQAQANLRFISLKDIDGSISFRSQIKNLEKLTFSVKNEASLGKYSSKVFASWAPSKEIIFDGTFTDNNSFMSSDASLTTPFQVISQLVLHSETERRDVLYTQKISADFNGKRVTDVDLSTSLGDKKSVSLRMRSPVVLYLDLEGSMKNKYEAALTASTDIINTGNGMKINSVFDPATNAVSIRYTCPINTISFDGSFNIQNTKFDFVLNDIRYGYSMDISDTKGQIKISLPSRSLLVSGSQISSTTEGAFLWDADKDETKKIGFRSVLRPNKDSMQADVTVMMPSIGKEVQIDSQMSVNKGRILFDGKTELTYSRDSRKKFTVMSRLEDISNNWSSKNYSFTFGISHPYTSVDMQVSSQFGNSNQKATGGLSMKYQTTRRETKTFSIHGSLDKVLNEFSFDMDTPMKKVGINGNAQTNSPYRLSLSNKYDSKRPLNTVFIFDTNKRSVDFQMNYDLDNPSSEFHIGAKYVNSSAIAAEIFHVVNRQRVTDAILSLRLNSSTLLHSRIHWRPEMISDLQGLSERKMNSYGRRLRNFADVASDNMKNELIQKARLFVQSFNEEVQPFAAVAAENMENLVKMYDTNEYYVRDITDVILEASNKAGLKLAQMSEVFDEYLNLASEMLNERIERCMVNYREKLQNTLRNLEETTGYVKLQSNNFYRNYADHAYNISRPIVQTVSDKYHKYVQYMNEINTSPVLSMANRYTSAIYGAHDLMNSGLTSFLNRNDVQYAKSISGRVLQQGQNAYKYWEIRENSEMLAHAVADWIREEIEEEIADIRATILNLMRSKTTVYDPANGEIQMEFHLPIPLKSLDVIPKVDFMPYITKARSYMPKVPSLSFPSADVRTWLPPFDAMATIEGNKITTFDGMTYDLDSSCTFMLARDNVNSNFSVALHKDGTNKTIIIVNGGNSIKLFTNGKVNVNEMPVSPPAIIKDVTVTSLDGHLTVNVANHVAVDYYQDIDTYMIKMNGYYFGKTSGLLGSYDNEPSNDLMTSFGKPTTSIERFAKTWDIGTERCR